MNRDIYIATLYVSRENPENYTCEYLYATKETPRLDATKLLDDYGFSKDQPQYFRLQKPPKKDVIHDSQFSMFCKVVYEEGNLSE
jgi:hypothetical protein